MLTEHFVASIHTPLKTSAAGFKDVGIFINELQPLAGQRQAFKRSATVQNCLAVSDGHIFAAQAEKAAVHVYNRERGNHEATIPFNEKITSLVLAASGFVLLLGTKGGRVIAWELATGRLTSTSQSHLQAVTCLAIDPTSNFLLSGSHDSNVLVWSLSSILSFSASDSASHTGPRLPIQSLSSQRGPITALAVGHGHGQANIAVSASEDQTAVVWDYKRGIALRIYLLSDIPRALVLDESDRGFYITYDNGCVQLIDFYEDGSHVNNLYDENDTTPVQPGETHVWKVEGQDLGGGLSLALSWDGTRLLSGHKSGKIVSWDVSKGSFLAVTDTLPGTVSNIIMVPVQGLLNADDSRTKLVEVTKPRMITLDAEGVISGDYFFSSQPKMKLSRNHLRAVGQAKFERQSSFQHALAYPSIPRELLESGVAELIATDSVSLNATDDGLSFVSLNGDKTKSDLVDLKAQNEHLLRQVAHLQTLQKASFVQIRDKTRIISTLVKEQDQLAEIARREHSWEIADANVEWNIYQQRQAMALDGNSKAALGSSEANKSGENKRMFDGVEETLDR